MTIPKLRCRIVAGSANNVLGESGHGEALSERGILYAPDYVINAGGLINVADELEGYNERRATRVMRIEDRIAASSPSPNATASQPTSPRTPWRWRG